MQNDDSPDYSDLFGRAALQDQMPGILCGFHIYFCHARSSIVSARSIARCSKVKAHLADTEAVIA